MNLHHKITMLTLLFCSVEVDAQNTPLTLLECRQMAIKASYNLKSSAEKRLYSEDMALAYRANYLPDISLKGEYLYSTASFNMEITGGYLPIFTNGVIESGSFVYMPDQSYELDVKSVYNASVVLMQPIYMGGKISGAYKLSKLGVELSALDEQRQEAEVLQRVDNAFYQLLELDEQLLSAKAYQTTVEEFLRQIESAHAHGMAKRNDVLKVSVRLNEAKLLSLKAANGVTLARMNLCYIIGMSLSTKELKLIEPKIIIEPLRDNTLDISERPEYLQLQKQVEAKELETKITKGDLLPSATAIASYGYTNGLAFNSNTLLNSAAFTAGVTVSVPIFHFSEGRRKVSAKQREVAIARNTLDDLSIQMSLELMQAINETNEAIEQVHLTQVAEVQAEENMRLSKNQYDVGMETIADYLEAQSLWQKAMSDSSAAKRMQRVAYTKYLRTTGELFVRPATF